MHTYYVTIEEEQDHFTEATKNKSNIDDATISWLPYYYSF